MMFKTRKRPLDVRDIHQAIKKRKVEWQWVQCDYCAKWRRIPATRQLYGQWNCKLNENTAQANCQAAQEIEVDEELVLRHYQAIAILPKKSLPVPKLQLIPPPAATNPPDRYILREPEVIDLYEPSHYPKPRRRNNGSKTSRSMGLNDVLKELQGSDPVMNQDRLKFYDKICQFLGEEPQINTLNSQIVNLHLLFNLVVARGGYRTVCQKKLWREVFRALPQYTKSHTSASNTLKRIYQNNLMAYQRKLHPQLS